MSKKRSAEDTIAGYYYQFDKTILEILNQESEQNIITVEGIEDIDFEKAETNETHAVQVKYHAKQEYKLNLVREPIILMYDDYKNRKIDNKTLIGYTLYIHLKDKWKSLEDAYLDPIENKENHFRFKDTKGFLKTYYENKNNDLTTEEENSHKDLESRDVSDFNITIINAKNFEGQFQETIQKISEVFKCDEYESKEYYYNNALKTIFDLAKEPDEEKRKTTPQKFKAKVNKKAFLFNRWYAFYKGKVNYIEFIKQKLNITRTLDLGVYKCLFIGKKFIDNGGIEGLVNIVTTLVDEYYQIGKSYASRSKIWTLVLDIEYAEMQKLKKKLIAQDIEYADGREDVQFNTEQFNKEPILNTNKNDTIKKASFQIKLITKERFKENKDKIDNIDVVLFFSDEDFETYVLLNEENPKKNPEIYQVNPIDKFDSLEDIQKIFDKIITGNDYFRIISIAPNLIQIEVTEPHRFKKENGNFTLGNYLKITDENGVSIIGILQSYRIKDINLDPYNPTLERKEPTFILEVQPMGYIQDEHFKRGGSQITIPPNAVQVADAELLRKIFSLDEKKHQNKIFTFGKLKNVEEPIDVQIDGNEFFNKHIAVVGSTGSGKSSTVAKILQEGIESNQEKQNNARVIIFDLHGEYHTAFEDENTRVLDVNNLLLPCWLMNGEELADMFVESGEFNSHNQYSQFRQAVTLNKEKYNPEAKVDFDSPNYFSIKEVIQYLENQNKATKYDDNSLAIETQNEDIEERFRLFDEITFKARTTSKPKVLKGNFAGEFDRFLSRIKTKVSDNRLEFIFKAGEALKTNNLSKILKQFLGFKIEEDNKETNVIIIDLSGTPFEVLDNVVSLITRLLFQYAYFTKRASEEIENPLLLVYEEAHNYIPKSLIITDCVPKQKTIKELLIFKITTL